MPFLSPNQQRQSTEGSHEGTETALKAVTKVRKQKNSMVSTKHNQFPGHVGDTFFLNSRRFLRDKPYNIKIQVKFAMPINERVMNDDELRPTLISVPEITVILFTRRLAYVQCTKNRPMCKNYTANYKTCQGSID